MRVDVRMNQPAERLLDLPVLTATLAVFGK
jgi:hypothetical protein